MGLPLGRTLTRSLTPSGCWGPSLRNPHSGPLSLGDPTPTILLLMCSEA